MFRRWLVLVLFVVAVLALPRRARADQSTAHGVAVAVLAFDSDDAEEQAEALTGAVRSRVRTASGWSLVETNQSLGMLTAALRCPAKPVTAECEQRIADQLKTDRYIYGYVAKGPKGQVTAEIHLYQRNKPDAVQRESYSDNLRDQNDEALRKVAQHALDALGASAVGTIVVHMGRENGEVVVDGDKRVPMKDGSARVEISPGAHAVEVAVSGQAPQKRNVVVVAGKETAVSLSLPTAAEKPAESSFTFPVRKVIAGGLAVAGVVGGVIAVSHYISYKDAQDKGAKINASTNPADVKLPPGKTADEACGKDIDDVVAICQANRDAKHHSLVAAVAGSVGVVLIGAGAYLWFTDKSDKEKSTSSQGTSFVPTFARDGGGFVLSGSF